MKASTYAQLGEVAGATGNVRGAVRLYAAAARLAPGEAHYRESMDVALRALRKAEL